jgi:hypothetical protein
MKQRKAHLECRQVSIDLRGFHCRQRCRLHDDIRMWATDAQMMWAAYKQVPSKSIRSPMKPWLLARHLTK